MKPSAQPDIDHAKTHYWTRVFKSVREFVEDLDRTEIDDALDRIAALERRVEELSAERSQKR